MLALKANAVSILLGVMLVGTLAGGYKIHQLGEEKRQGLEDSIEQMTGLIGVQADTHEEYRQELFDMDDKNNKIMGALNEALQGNPNLELWLATSLSDVVVGWVWDFWSARPQGKDYPAEYVPRTRKEAIAVGMTNKELLMTACETIIALDHANLQFKKEREKEEKERKLGLK